MYLPVQLKDAISDELRRNTYRFNPNRPAIPLSVTSYSTEEVLEVLDTLLTTRVTMGEKVLKFEEKFSSYIGCKAGVMFNSGSSANLVAVNVLTNPNLPQRLRAGFEAVVPAVTWSTTLFPIVQCGGVPVLADVDAKSLTLNSREVTAAVSPRTGLLFPVHLLGNPCDVPRMIRAVDKRVKVIEDCCEAHGAEINGRKVGSFGDMGTFSFFFSHHISTIEGGMLVTNNEEYADTARSLRAHGWVREMRKRHSLEMEHPLIDGRYLFVNVGYNLRPTELQGAFGLCQMDRLEGFIRARRRNASYLLKRLSRWSAYLELQREKQGTRHVWFAFPVTVADDAPFSKDQLVTYLEGKGIETRPVMGGNLAEQPVMSFIKYRTSGPLEVAKRTMRRSFLFGVHQGLDKAALEYIVCCFEEFFKKRGL